jgi:hypothetical protein
MARFWAAALGYELAPALAGFATWNDFYREIGVPEEELVDGADRISDPEGHGPAIWFHVVPAVKAVKNRLHLDIRASGERTDPIEARMNRSTRRPAGWPLWAPPSRAYCPRKGSTTTRSECRTRKATSSISTDPLRRPNSPGD